MDFLFGSVMISRLEIPLMHRAIKFLILRRPSSLVSAVLAIALIHVLPDAVSATDTGAVGNGNWSSVATWTNGVPGIPDNAYIGSTAPAGAAATATVALSQNTTGGAIYLGNG